MRRRLRITKRNQRVKNLLTQVARIIRNKIMTKKSRRLDSKAIKKSRLHSNCRQKDKKYTVNIPKYAQS